MMSKETEHSYNQEINPSFLENPLRWTSRRWKGIIAVAVGTTLVLAAI